MGIPVDELLETTVGMYTREFVGTAVVCGRGDGLVVETDGLVVGKFDDVMFRYELGNEVGIDGALLAGDGIFIDGKADNCDVGISEDNNAAVNGATVGNRGAVLVVGIALMIAGVGLPDGVLDVVLK